jgi:hypothetical protein
MEREQLDALHRSDQNMNRYGIALRLVSEPPRPDRYLEARGFLPEKIFQLIRGVFLSSPRQSTRRARRPQISRSRIY